MGYSLDDYKQNKNTTDEIKKSAEEILGFIDSIKRNYYSMNSVGMCSEAIILEAQSIIEAVKKYKY